MCEKTRCHCTQRRKFKTVYGLKNEVSVDNINLINNKYKLQGKKTSISYPHSTANIYVQQHSNKWLRKQEWINRCQCMWRYFYSKLISKVLKEIWEIDSGHIAEILQNDELMYSAFRTPILRAWQARLDWIVHNYLVLKLVIIFVTSPSQNQQTQQEA